MDHREKATLPAFGAKPWVIRFNGTEKATPSLINPFDGSSHEANLLMIQGKTCLHCFGEWLLMFDKQTKECFLLDLASLLKISLPLLLEPLESLARCTISSPTPPDCAVMFASDHAMFLLYCRLGDKEWSKFFKDFEYNDHGFFGEIFGTQGKTYVVTTMSPIIVINTTHSSLHIERTEADDIREPKTCHLHDGVVTHWVESGGDIFFVRFYMYGYHKSAVFDVDIHRRDTLEYTWEQVESIGDRTILEREARCAAPASLLSK